MAKRLTYNFKSEDGRSKLATRTKTYFETLDRNCALGFRKGTTGETWSAKRIVNRVDRTEQFGTLADVTEEKRYKVAKEKALAWFKTLDEAIERTGKVAPAKMTLADVLQAYIDELGKDPDNGDKKARTARSKFKLLVAPFKDASGKSWAKRPIARITTPEFAAWREWMTALPTMRGGSQRAVSTVNRDITDLRSALNLAAQRHGIADRWTPELKRAEEDENSPEARAKRRSLDVEERRRLIAGAEQAAPELVPFIKLMLTVPVRPGALANLKVGSYKREGGTHKLWIGKDKNNGNRWVSLRNDPATFALMDALCHPAGAVAKLPSAPLLTNATSGGAWDAWSWGKEIKKAGAAAELPAEISMYWLRHSRITDMIRDNVAPMEVAKMAGTSVEIIEKHYHRTSDESEQRALRVAGY